MKKPWQVGILSIFPGLGFWVLGKFRQGMIAFVIVAFLVFIGVVIPIEDITISAYTLAFVAWLSQIWYAVLIAQRKMRLEANPVSAAMLSQVMPIGPAASPAEKRLYEAKLDMLPLLLPGEYLKIALPGVIGAPSFIGSVFIILVALGGGSAAGAPTVESVYLGLTENDFLLASTDMLRKPNQLRRIPLSRVMLIEYGEGLTSDEIILNIGDAKPIKVKVGHGYREGTKQLLDLLARASLSTNQPVYSTEIPQPDKTSAVSSQVRGLYQGPVPRGAVRASTYVAQAGISALGLLAGYAIGYGLLRNYFIGGDPALKEILEPYTVHIACCLPSVVPVAIGIGALAVLMQSRFKASAQAARIGNGVVSLVLGVILYIPFQFLLLVAASV